MWLPWMQSLRKKNFWTYCAAIVVKPGFLPFILVNASTHFPFQWSSAWVSNLLSCQLMEWKLNEGYGLFNCGNLLLRKTMALFLGQTNWDLGRNGNRRTLPPHMMAWFLWVFLLMILYTVSLHGFWHYQNLYNRCLALKPWPLKRHHWDAFLSIYQVAMW